MRDRFGIGWRKELAAGIFDRLSEIDVVEVIAEDYFEAPRREVRALQTLAGFVPVTVHGTSLGPASAAGVEGKRLDRMARLVERVRPESWSEHLAFVRGGGIEIGHLAAPPRTELTVEGAADNLRQAAVVVGRRPMVENIATLVDPPASTMSEAAWIRGIVEASGCELLLDLHNVYANGTNHGYEPQEFLRRIPLDRVAVIHVAGGRWIEAPGGGRRLLDDHLHAVPDPVYTLLEEVASRASQPLTIILERDGKYPAMDELMAELAQARQAVERGRRRADERAAA